MNASMNAPASDTELYAEIGRDVRRRAGGVVITLVMTSLMAVGFFNSMRMMHGSDFHVAVGTIVEVVKDPQSGETLMTSEFRDAAGTLHRDTQTAGYHYARGEPVVGQPIEYLYKNSEYTGELRGFPRADRILQWVFGLPMALFALMSVLASWYLSRKRALRRRLVGSGRREAGAGYAISRRSVPILTGNSGPVEMWRLEARYFEPERAEFVECHSDWQHSPLPELGPDSPVSPILLDPTRPGRYWLPVGALARP